MIKLVTLFNGRFFDEVVSIKERAISVATYKLPGVNSLHARLFLFIMKLELKHLAPYLPYGLQLKDKANPKANITYNFLSISIENGDRVVINYGSNNFLFIHEVHPILRPLSELKYNSLWFSHIFDITTHFNWENSIGELMRNPKEVRGMWPQYILEYLLENHFDVFGLIDAGLAIDINNI